LLSIGQTLEWFGLAHEGRRGLLALLTYASLAVPTYLILAHVPRFERLSWVEETFVVPLAQSALLAIVLATLGLPLAVAWDWLTPATACTVWLAALWLVLALTSELPAPFAVFQGVLTVAVLLGVTAWLDAQDWVNQSVYALFSFRGWQAYLLGLAGLSLAWMIVRRFLRQSRDREGAADVAALPDGRGSNLAQRLLEPGRPALDRRVLPTAGLAQ